MEAVAERPRFGTERSFGMGRVNALGGDELRPSARRGTAAWACFVIVTCSCGPAAGTRERGGPGEIIGLVSDLRMRFRLPTTRREITCRPNRSAHLVSRRPPTPDPHGKVLVSACLLGQAVRYDGGTKPCQHPVLARWLAEGRLVLFCPEMAGGLGVPRPPAECIGGDGDAVRRGDARILDVHGHDVTAAFRAGAEAALALCRKEGVLLAVLKEDSPSCGSARIADGTFSGTPRAGLGLTTAVLRAAGIQVISEEDSE